MPAFTPYSTILTRFWTFLCSTTSLYWDKIQWFRTKSSINVKKNIEADWSWWSSWKNGLLLNSFTSCWKLHPPGRIKLSAHLSKVYECNKIMTFNYEHKSTVFNHCLCENNVTCNKNNKITYCFHQMNHHMPFQSFS